MDICQKLFTIPLRIMCVILLTTQMVLLDVYLAKYISKIWLTWIVADVITIVLFITVMVLTYINPAQEKCCTSICRVMLAGPNIPVLYIAWAMYSLVLFLKILYCSEKIVPKLDAQSDWGANNFKFTLALTAPLFLLYLLSQGSAISNSEHRRYIDKLASGVTFDIFDTVNILDILFVQQTRVHLPFSMFITILGIALINILMPLIPLFLINLTYYGENKLSDTVLNIYRISMILVINLPYLAIRIQLIHFYGHNTYIFLMKNILSIFVVFYSIYEQRLQINTTTADLEIAAEVVVEEQAQ